MADDRLQLPAEPPEDGIPDWVVTYGDMMSLLLSFFVLLLSFSQMDTARFKEISGSLERAFGVQRKNPVYNIPMGMKMIARDFDQAFVEQAKVGRQESEFYEALSELATLQKKGLLEVQVNEEQITLRLMGQTTFNSGSAAIRAEMIPVLESVGEVLRKSNREIVVAGHTDNVPISGGVYSSNLELSAARAASVVEFFLSRQIVPPERIATMGFGEHRPLVPNDTPENREQNRRVDIILARRNTSPSPFEASLQDDRLLEPPVISPLLQPVTP